MTRLKAAVIGVGSMGSRHARIYAALPETDLVAVVSATEATSIRVAAQYGGKAYTDYREMLAAERLDDPLACRECRGLLRAALATGAIVVVLFGLALPWLLPIGAPCRPMSSGALYSAYSAPAGGTTRLLLDVSP